MAGADSPIRTLQALISGSSDLDVKDWRTHTELENYTVHDPQIRWFWTVVEAMDSAMKVCPDQRLISDLYDRG